MCMRSAFETYHPAICFWMFVLAIVLSMVVRHPVFLAASVVLAATCYATTKGPRALKLMAWVVPLFVLVTAMNPLFNPMGDTVLFTYLGGRTYTFESLCYGAATAAMVVAMFLWFGSFNAVLTSDKITYLFRKVAPAGALVLTMIMRLVPNYQKKTTAFATARACIGKSVGEGKWIDKVKNGSSLLSMLTSWALEGSVITADSMRSRGYGLPGRSYYSLYKFTVRDGVMAAVTGLLFVGAAVGLFVGAADVEYIPAISIPPITGLGMVGMVCYVAFLALPTIVNVVEQAKWRISLSRV